MTTRLAVTVQYLALALLLVAALTALLGRTIDSSARTRNPESVVRSFLAALQDRAADEALEFMSQPAREKWGHFVLAYLLGLDYRVLGIGVPATPLVQRLWGVPERKDIVVTISAELTNDLGESWRVTTTARLERDGTRWYITVPPFIPAEWLEGEGIRPPPYL